MLLDDRRVRLPAARRGRQHGRLRAHPQGCTDAPARRRARQLERRDSHRHQIHRPPHSVTVTACALRWCAVGRLHQTGAGAVTVTERHGTCGQQHQETKEEEEEEEEEEEDGDSSSEYTEETVPDDEVFPVGETPFVKSDGVVVEVRPGVIIDARRATEADSSEETNAGSDNGSEYTEETYLSEDDVVETVEDSVLKNVVDCGRRRRR